VREPRIVLGMGKANRPKRRAKQQRRSSPPGFGEKATAAQSAAAGEPLWPGGRPKGPELTPEQSAAIMLSSAIRAFLSNDLRTVDTMVSALVERPDLGGWRQIVARTLEYHLTSAVTEAWQRGWQPADLGRLVGRRFSARHVRLIRDAIAAELSGYAALTLDPRWAAQLDELGARVWWQPGETYFQAQLEHSALSWTELVPVAVELVALVSTVVRLEQLGPLPGTARPPNASRQPGPDVDERVLSRVRALLAKAEATSSEAEAEAFTAGAQERMARYSIDLAMLAGADPSRSNQPSGRRIGLDNPYESSKALLLNAVSEANRCRAIWTQELGFCTVIGFEPDLDAVETLFTSLLVQAVTAMTRAGSRAGPGARSRTRSFRQSFLAAYAYRIGERLAEVIEVQTEAASAEPGGKNLLPVLASRNQAVEDAVGTMFPTLTSRATTSVTDAEGWHSGRGAADQASLHTGRAVRES
jgi:hypothetical protein